MKKLKKFLFVIPFLFILIFIASCSDNSPSTQNGATGEMETITDLYDSTSNRKIYYTVNCSINTDNMTVSISKVKTATNLNGGYFENSEINGTNSNRVSFTIRVKTENLNAFLEELSDFGEVTSQTMKSTDITSQYNNVEATIMAYETEVSILQTCIAAEVDPAKVIEYSKRIAELNIILNQYYRQLNNYDSLIEYSTIYLYLYNTQTTSTGFGEKVKDAFNGSIAGITGFFQFILLAIIYTWPFLLIIGGVVTGLLIYSKKKKQKRHEEIEKIKRNKEKEQI